MVDIQSVAAEIRRGKKRKKIDRKKERKKLQGKNIMALLHRAAIKKKDRLKSQGKNIMVCPIIQGDHKQDKNTMHASATQGGYNN